MGLIFLWMAKSSLGNCDGNAVDGIIERQRPAEDKAKNARQAAFYFAVGIALLTAGIAWGIWMRS